MELTCVICLEDIVKFNNKKTLKCEHMFHKKCLNNFYEKNIYINYECPICKEIDSKCNIFLRPDQNKSKFEKIILHNNNLITNLKKFFKIPVLLEFLSHLNDNAIISGSFILSTILNETYENNDIDIYIDNHYKYFKLFKFLVKSDFQLTRSTDNYKYLNNNKQNLIYCVDTFIYKNNENIKIDIIYNKLNKMVIRDCFDLDIVKNYYNGTDYYVYNLTKLVYKKDYIHESKLNPKTEKRIIKYRNRGFEISILHN
jgi:hypothetical protein